MEKSDLFELTKRLRRSTRQPDVIALCDEAERLALAGQSVAKGPKRDRAKYMRDWRAKQKPGVDAVPA